MLSALDIGEYKRFDGNIYRNLKKLSLLFCYVNEHDFESIRVGWGGGGYSQKNWAGVCGSLPKTPTLFMTKMCDIPYLIYDLSKTLKPYLDLFQSCVIILL